MRIFDTFPFDGELDMLEFHLSETFAMVDIFVIIEAGETYRGSPKSYNFAQNSDRFAWARHKIRHVCLPRLGTADSTSRNRAAAQRQAMMLAMHDASPDDIVLLLDVDEIPSPGVLRQLRATGLDGPRRLAMTRHYGFANALGPLSPCCPSPALPFASACGDKRPQGWADLDDTWFGHSGVAVHFSELADQSAFQLRFGSPTCDILPDAGRHFSSVDPATRLETKLARVFHSEWDGDRARDPDHLARARGYRVHHRGWWYAQIPTGDLPDDIARLITRSPELAAPQMRFGPSRKLFRHWAWLRLWSALPNGLVAVIDRNFERLLPLIGLPLLIAGVGHRLLARVLPLTGGRIGERPLSSH